MIGLRTAHNGHKNGRQHQPELIDLRHIDKAYKTRAGDFYALKDISFTARRGEFITVSGKSGAGKSTLVNMIAGIDHPTSGEVWVDGTRVHTLNENQGARWRGRNLGVVFQGFQLLPTLTILQNVMLPMALAGFDSPLDRRERAMYLLEQVDIGEQAHKRPMMLSGGQRQRAAVARALANNPPLILADEPTGNLDSRTADQVFGVLSDLAAQGTTILLVTHDEELASRTDRIIRLVDGEIVEDTRCQQPVFA
ncbi:MAG: ABC transporter ATP-binding protein [Anaerolineae bacterium]|nr:ABC transporter ATP-binding protein [Anaerolineae bacterium]